MTPLIFAAATATPTMGEIIMSQLPYLLIIGAIFYFLILRPQTQQVKRHQAMLAGLKRGDQVVTKSGIMGKVHKIEDDKIVLEVADGVRINVIKSMIGDVYNPVAATETTAKKK